MLLTAVDLLQEASPRSLRFSVKVMHRLIRLEEEHNEKIEFYKSGRGIT
jgi:hypothetical protein